MGKQTILMLTGMMLSPAAISIAATSFSTDFSPAPATSSIEPFDQTLQDLVVNSLNPMNAPMPGVDVIADPGSTEIDPGEMTPPGEIWTTDPGGDPAIDWAATSWFPRSSGDAGALAADSEMHVFQALEMPPLSRVDAPPAVPLPPAFGVGLATFCLSVYAFGKRRSRINRK